jgi:hypothetical protein
MNGFDPYPITVYLVKSSGGSTGIALQQALAIPLGGWAENAFAIRRRLRPRQFFRMLQQPTKEDRGGWDLRFVGIPYPSDLSDSLLAECLADWAGQGEFEACESRTEGAGIRMNLLLHLLSPRAQMEQRSQPCLSGRIVPK